MTKSQNKKKDLCITSEQLTKQWKNWQLEGFRWYYVKFKTGEIDICWLTEWSNDELGTGGKYFDGIKEENIIEVLAQVPDYDEYQKLLSDQLAKIEGEEINAELEARLKKTQELELELRKENAQLKDLLKECESSIQYYQETYGAMDLDTYTLLAKLKELEK